MNIKHILLVAGLATVITGCNNNAADNNHNTAMNERPITNNGVNNIQNVRYNTNTNTTPNLDLADEVADKVTELKEIKHAVVLKTDENAFVAVEMEGDKEGEVTNEVEEKVADSVRKVDKDIDNVYVSSNPDFYDRMTGYGEDIEQGDPISGFFNEFTETVRRVFPNYR